MTMDNENKIIANMVLETFYNSCYVSNSADCKKGLIQLCEENTKAYWCDGQVNIVVDCSRIDVHQYEEILTLFGDGNDDDSLINEIREKEEMKNLGIAWKLEFISAKDYR